VIARIWNGTAAPEHAEAYVRHLREHTFPQLSSIAGHRGGYVLRRAQDDRVDFMVITLWDSFEAIRRFAGDAADVAVVPPAAQALLASWDARAVHWDVVVDASDSTLSDRSV
jgi:heme-degrading monooxygenase HmoA